MKSSAVAVLMETIRNQCKCNLNLPHLSAFCQESMGIDFVQLAIMLLRHQRSLDHGARMTLCNLITRVHRDVINYLVHNYNIASDICLAFLFTKDTNVMQFPDLFDALVDTLLNQPWSEWCDTGFANRLHNLLQDEPRPQSTTSPLLEALLHPSRWNAFWNAMASSSTRYSSSSFASILSILQNIWRMTTSMGISMLPIPHETIVKLREHLDILRAVKRCDRAFVSWLVTTFYGDAIQLLNSAMVKFTSHVGRTRGGKLKGFRADLLNDIYGALLLLSYEGINNTAIEKSKAAVQIIVSTLQDELVRRVGSYILRQMVSFINHSYIMLSCFNRDHFCRCLQ